MAKRSYRLIKRFLDIVVAGLLLAVLALPMALIALAVALDTPGKAIFSQLRVGRGGVFFRLYKFRTMLPGEARQVTRTGRVLRKLSLDELPQLVNVLKGDMSLIGPRPLIPEETELHRERARFGVYELRPGMTGLAQIHGRDFVTAEEKLRWDRTYWQHFGFRQDVKIFFATLPRVLRGDGVKDSEGDADGI